MKSWSIAARLYLFFAVVILALGGGFALFIRADDLDARANERNILLVTGAAALRHDMLQMSDALRGLMLEPANAGERKRKLDADAHLVKTVDSLKPLLQGQPELLKAVAAVGAFDESTLDRLENQLMDMVGKDNTATLAFYTSTYLPARHQQDGLIEKMLALTESQISGELTIARSQRDTALWLMAAIFGVTVVVTYFFARSISRPLQNLTAAVGVLAEGDLSARLPEARGGAEIGHLTDSFERLVQSLRTFSDAANRVAAGDLTAEFKPQSDRDVMGNALAKMGGNLATLVADVQRSSVGVASAINEVAATAKQQQTTANEVAATTTEIGATSKEISATSRDLAQSVSHVSEGAHRTAALADSGRESLGKMEETMRRVTDAAGGINSRLAVLNDKAANIGSVVTTIAKVADQTNLLSLNAAIEAEKAGEYGRGFAVVATEIRRLADQSAAATVDIEQLVREIQSAVTAGVMGMDKFSEEVRRGVAEVEKVATQLAQIIQNVQASTPRIAAVSEGMQAQTTGAEQISQALTQLGEAARQTVESLQQSNETVQRLDDAARGLRAGVGRFTLKR
ncbi:MAG: methyl-accepting chemotaxis sensory transducer [Verrucomicrobiota bacterium]|jgi:methyl-accepting chemotaxis protein WspA